MVVCGRNPSFGGTRGARLSRFTLLMINTDRGTFDRYVGIDYSGAATPTASLKGLRVYMADRSTPPQEVQPPPSPRKYWTRRGVAEWLMALLSENSRTLVGVDHGFSFPLQYFEAHRLPLDWPLAVQAQIPLLPQLVARRGVKKTRREQHYLQGQPCHRYLLELGPAPFHPDRHTDTDCYSHKHTD